MRVLADVKAWATLRLDTHRAQLEGLNNDHDATQIARGRIAELKELLAALDEQERSAPPIWDHAS